MKKILSSQKLIATEWNRAKAVSEWCVFHDADNETKMKLVRLLHFELLERSELQALLANGNLSSSHETMLNTLTECWNRFMMHTIKTKFCTKCYGWSPSKRCCSGHKTLNVIAISVNMTISISEPQPQTFCRTSEFVLSFRNQNFGFFLKGWELNRMRYACETIEMYSFEKSRVLNTNNDLNFSSWRIGNETSIPVNLTFALL